MSGPTVPPHPPAGDEAAWAEWWREYNRAWSGWHASHGTDPCDGMFDLLRDRLLKRGWKETIGKNAKGGLDIYWTTPDGREMTEREADAELRWIDETERKEIPDA